MLERGLMLIFQNLISLRGIPRQREDLEPTRSLRWHYSKYYLNQVNSGCNTPIGDDDLRYIRTSEIRLVGIHPTRLATVPLLISELQRRTFIFLHPAHTTSPCIIVYSFVNVLLSC